MYNNVIAMVFLVGTLLFSCQTEIQNEEKKLLEAISTIEGNYVLDEETNQYYYNKKEELEQLLKHVNDKEVLIHILHKNMDNKEKSNSYFQKEQVLVGNICYEALTQTIYYEPIDEQGDIMQDWNGYIPAYSNIEKLSAAKKSWEKVIQSKTYVIQ